MYIQNINDDLYSVIRATIYFEKEPNGSTHTFGSVEQAEQYIQDRIKQYNTTDKYYGEITAYKVEEMCYIPCEPSNPGGKLYQSPRYRNFVDLEEQKCATI